MLIWLLNYNLQACGFEILVSQSKTSSQRDELNKDWQRYKQSLTGKGYFKVIRFMIR